MASTAVVIPTFNRCSTLLFALSKVFAALPPAHRVIVIDSGSSDGTLDALRKRFPQAHAIEGNSSCWWAAATNLGIEKARALGCQSVITYNDDNVASADLFSNLALAARSAPDSIIAAVCCYLDRPQTVFFAGRMRAKGTDRFYYLDHDVPLSALGKGLRRVDMLHGMCTRFPMAVFDKLGLFDEQAFPQVFADDDLLMRASRAGFPLQVALEAVVLNDRSKTGINPYDRRLGPGGILRLLTSRRSTFQVAARARFLWRYQRGFFFFCKTWLFDYLRLFTLVFARWMLPFSAFHRLGIHWGQRLQRK
ncbi:MAG TPA: glycosyltransferase [Candidatus Binatia bacterium]|nr:glycosyltransferase [Candidatus Binatia bacterium]